MTIVIWNILKLFAKLEVHTEVIRGITTLYENDRGHSLVVQWLGLCTSKAGATGLIPGWGTKIPQDLWHSKKKKKKEREFWHMGLLQLISKYVDLVKKKQKAPRDWLFLL